jgi:hypothetical protein
MFLVRLGEKDDTLAHMLAIEELAKAHTRYGPSSWGGSASSGEAGYVWHLVQRGMSFFVSAGTTGYRPDIPRR